MRTTFLSIGFLSLTLATVSASAGITEGAHSRVWTASWSPAALDLDSFLDGFLGGSCGVRQLTEDEILDVGGLPDSEKSNFLTFAGGGSGCLNHCMCGGCIVINGNVACSACYACCTPELETWCRCTSSLQGYVLAECGCKPAGGSGMGVLS